MFCEILDIYTFQYSTNLSSTGALCYDALLTKVVIAHGNYSGNFPIQVSFETILRWTSRADVSAIVIAFFSSLGHCIDFIWNNKLLKIYNYKHAYSPT